MAGAGGDQFVKVKIEIPRNLTSEQKDILRRFDDSAEEAQYKEKKASSKK